MVVYHLVLPLCYLPLLFMKYTIRPILRTEKANSEGLCPIYIVFTLNRKRTYIKTGYRIKEANWNGEVTGLFNAGLINAEIRKKISDLEREILERKLDGRTVSVQAIKHLPVTNFFSFVKEVKGNTIKDRKECNRIRAYVGDSLSISDIDITWLRKYEQHQRKIANRYKGLQKNGLSQNTINTTFKWLRRVLNLAKREGMVKNNPISEYGVPKYIQGERIFLEGKERERWYKYWKEKKVSGSLYVTLTYFLIGVFSGLRYQDWSEATNRVHGNFLRLRAKKNKEWVVLPIGKSLVSLLKVAKTLPPPFSGDKSRQHLKIIAGRMDFKKEITTHSARHSFGGMCAELGLPKSVTAELMGISVQTVEVYYHLTGQNIIEQAAALKGV
jgi:integrase/recombinase XerD